MEVAKLSSEELKEAQKAAMEKEWKDFKKIVMENQENILKQFDLFWNKAIDVHAATRSHPQALEGRELERMEEVKLFPEEMKKAQEAAMKNDWKVFEKEMTGKRENILKQFDLFGNNAIHVATRSNPPHQILGKLIEMVPAAERWQALCKKNGEGNTVLHEIVFSKMAEDKAGIVFGYEDQLLPREITDKTPLLERRNKRGESPLFVAAMNGKLKILKFMAKRVSKENLGKHFRPSDKYNALHAAIIAQHFNTAIWLVKQDEKLAKEKDEKDLTCLQLLAKMPQVFRSQVQMGLVKSIIYQVLPDEYDDNHKYSGLDKGKKDVENGKQEDSELSKSGLNYRFWKYLCTEFEGIDHMWKEKKKHKLAEQLAKALVIYDLSWQVSKNEYNWTTLTTMPRDPLKVATSRRASAQMKEERRKNIQKRPERTALFTATKSGIVEIVENFLQVYPAAIYHVTENQQNILNMAVKYRQMKILNILEKRVSIESLVAQITVKGRTVLHEAARMDYCKAQHLAGVTFLLQDELHWYDKVRTMIPEHYKMHCDIDGYTPEDMLEIEHDEMLKEAQKWLKETAQSCSTVAILVATVVFAAAYTIPGGTENGTPVLLHSSNFLFFTITDVVALATSLASVAVFLSILTSPCELWDFHKSLPRKLHLGFALLFLSLMTTMLSFSATMLLTIRLEWKNWTSTLIYIAAFFPVAFFAVIQFPVYVMAQSITKHLRKQLHQLFPAKFIKKHMHRG